MNVHQGISTMHRAMTLTAALALSATVSGCFTSSRIQKDYIAQRDECRGFAERNIGQLPPPQAATPALQKRAQSANLAGLFSECMFNTGWTVAAPNQKGNPPRLIAGGKPELDQLTGAAMRRQPQPVEANRQPPPSQQNMQFDPNQAAPQGYVAPSSPLPANRQPVNPPQPLMAPPSQKQP
jgi:hypothetical protein